MKPAEPTIDDVEERIEYLELQRSMVSEQADTGSPVLNALMDAELAGIEVQLERLQTHLERFEEAQ